ncbi:MAG: site-2 protease family protein [Oscillospiraceae bacterium]|nr:site-2 protease family protein [Oscillospiraceae bacterium]
MTLRDFIADLDYTIIISAVAAVIAITFHEFSHGLASYIMGDKTAKYSGRMSLNPLRHIDIVGIICLIVFHFGWAKPVPVNMAYFKKPRLGMAVCALAGPLSNMVLAFVSLVLSAVCMIFANTGIGYWLFIFFNRLAVINVCLGIFNIIPIPPLDGSKIVFSFLPDRIYAKLMRYERFGMIILVIVLITGVASPALNTAYNAVLNGLWRVANFPLKIYLGM